MPGIPVCHRMGCLVFSYRFPRPLSLLFRTFNFMGQGPDYFVVTAEGAEPKLAVERQVLCGCSSVFLP
jgi:hypothetical protein